MGYAIKETYKYPDTLYSGNGKRKVDVMATKKTTRSKEDILLALEIMREMGISTQSYAYEELVYALPERDRPITPTECTIDVEVTSPGGELTSADGTRIRAAIAKNWKPLDCSTKTRQVIVTPGSFSW
jgi:hypothetical protein